MKFWYDSLCVCACMPLCCPSASAHPYFHACACACLYVCVCMVQTKPIDRTKVERVLRDYSPAVFQRAPSWLNGARSNASAPRHSESTSSFM